MKIFVCIALVFLTSMVFFSARAQTIGPLSETFGVELDLLTAHTAKSRVEYRATITALGPAAAVAIATYDDSFLPPALTGDQVLLVPDNHGRIAAISVLHRLLKRGDIDWLAIEMFDSENQSAINSFLVASSEAEARTALQAVFRRMPIGWVNYWGGDTTFENDPYIQILRLVKFQRIRVIALEERSYRPDFGAGRKNLLGITVRNQYWVRKMPRSGRGLVFGGALHFLSTTNKNVQNFLVERGQTDLLAYDFGLSKTLKPSIGPKINIRLRPPRNARGCAELWR